MKFAVVVFPGSNCDHDAYYAARHVLGQDAELVWHKDTGLRGADVVILPGGFAHGDYLRTGAIARFSPIMQAVRVDLPRRGGPVLGICNGFQVLLESGLLPGAMLSNSEPPLPLRTCVHLRVEQTDTPFTARVSAGPGAAHSHRARRRQLFAEPEVLERLERNRQVIFRYTDGRGVASDAANPNGSVGGIAGICNDTRNVVGLMPHPERACEPVLGSADGLLLFESAVAAVTQGSFAVVR
jgi:phosphoribosylformylglycinamidine synthase subunit PurQ / glutaminase